MDDSQMDKLVHTASWLLGFTGWRPSSHRSPLAEEESRAHGGEGMQQWRAHKFGGSRSLGSWEMHSCCIAPTAIRWVVSTTEPPQLFSREAVWHITESTPCSESENRRLIPLSSTSPHWTNCSASTSLNQALIPYYRVVIINNYKDKINDECESSF